MKFLTYYNQPRYNDQRLFVIAYHFQVDQRLEYRLTMILIVYVTWLLTHIVLMIKETHIYG
jgi:hypothetical protein